jgi:dihydrodipicolinate synthase/N-acetylneuraminate lyase
MLRPRRRIEGVSAVLLPFEGGRIDWPSFESLLEKTVAAGLTPAVNMDTGYVHLLTIQQQDEVLERTRSVLSGRRFVAGAFVSDAPGDVYQPQRHLVRMEKIQSVGGLPILFPCHGMKTLPDDQLLDSFRQLGRDGGDFLAFELGEMFAPFGRIFSLDVYAGLMEIPHCLGAKHSSLNRELEWRRLQLRDRLRPEFKVYTGNDLAIDMVMYGSDYLLGLSAAAPDLFARRDALWQAGDPAFYEVNDLLQYLGFFAFRPPVPGYRHSVATVLHQRGWIKTGEPHPQSIRRPDSDALILADIVERMAKLNS